MTRLRRSVFGLVAAALTFAVAPFAGAQDFAGVVHPVMNPGAKPLITSRIDDTRLMPPKALAVPGMKEARDMGRVPDAMPMSLTLNLQRPREEEVALRNLDSQTHDPTNAMFGKTLTPVEYAKTFGLAGSDLDAITGWLTGAGLEVISVDNGRLTVSFRGTARQVSQLLHTEIHTFQAADGTSHYANALPLQVPAALGRIYHGISGIQNFTVPYVRNFNGPVTDFTGGKFGPETETSEAPKTAPAVHLDGIALRDASFTASKYSELFGDSTQLNVRLGGDAYPVKGSLAITDENGKSIAYVADVTACASSSGDLVRNCNFTYKRSTPGGGMLTALYSGDDHNRAAKLRIIANAAGPTPSYTVVNMSPYMYYDGGPGNVTFTTVISYAGSVAPTGTYTATAEDGNGDVGFGTLNLTGCTATAADNLLTCVATITQNGLDADTDSYGPNEMYFAYGGDANYAASNGYVFGYDAFENGTKTPSLTVQGSFTTAETYGTATAESGVTGFTEIPSSGGYNPGYSTCGAVVNFTGPVQLGNLGTYNGYACSSTAGTSCAFTFNEPAFTLPSVVTPGTYSITATYSGDALQFQSSRCYYVPVASTTALSVTINEQTPIAAMTTSAYATPAPTTTQTYGSLSAFTVYGTLAWTGVGVPPAKANLAFTSTAAGSFSNFTCAVTYTNSTNVLAATPYKCSATFTPTATDAAGSYNINLGYTTDGVNYNTTASTTAHNYVINEATADTIALTPSPLVSPYGSTTGVTLTATVSGLGTTPSGTVNFSGPYTTYGSLSATSCTFSAATSCSVTFTPNGTTAASATPYSPFITATTASNTNYATATATDTLRITQLTTSLALVAATPGSTTTGVTSTTLTATLSPAISGVTVTFTDAATGATQTAATNSSGVASVSATGTVAGLNNYTASIAGTTNYTAATSNTVAVYYAGILFSTTGLHDFSGLITYQGQQVEGTVDGTKLGPYGVTVYNFTSSAQALTYTAPSSDQAFSYTTTCGASLASGASCAYEFYYAPPYGDGCTVGSNCTTDSQGYPQGTYESANWNVAAPNGVLTGIGDKQFDRYGAVTLPGTLAGKAILAQGSLSVSPTTYSFGNWASGVTSNTLTVVVSNSSAAPVAFTFTGPSTSEFTVTNNTCATPLGANASCNIYVTFEGANPSTYTDSLTIQPSGSAAIMVSLSGTVQTNSGLTITSNNHNFGNVTDGTTATFAFGVTNNSGTAQPVTLTYTAAAGYTVSNSCPASLAAAATCGITVQFAPTTAGAVTQSLTIGSNTFILPGGTSSSPYTDTVTVSGTGVAGGQFTATSVAHNFGAVTVGVSAGNYGVELSNNTSSTVTFSLGQGFTNGANGFSLVGSSCNSGSLAPNANCELIFSFDPTATGFVSAAYGITSSVSLYSGGAVVSPEQITLSGTGQ